MTIRRVAGRGLSQFTVCVSSSSRIIGGKRQGLANAQWLLIDFVVRRAARAIVIDHPFPADEDVAPILEEYNASKLGRRSRFPLPRRVAVGGKFSSSLFFYYALKLLDFISCIYFVLQSKKRVNIYVGFEEINCLAGLLLRLLHKVDFVIYYAMDYSRSRFSSTYVNTAFLGLDRFCCIHADVVWNEFDSFENLRKKLWKTKIQTAQVTVGSHSPPPAEGYFHKRARHWIVYLGGLDVSQGVQVVIGAMPKILSRVPDAEFHIIGDGRNLSKLRRQVSGLNVDNRVIFHGFLPDEEAKKLLALCRVGVAPYVDQVPQLQLRPYFDSSKMRYYASCGVPTIISNAIPPMADLVEGFHAGRTTSPDYESFADAVTVLLTDEVEYERCLKGCFLLADTLSSERFFSSVFPK